MIVTHNLTIDLMDPGIRPAKLHMVQGDANTRVVAITLTAGEEAFQIPSGAAALVRYRKTDGTGGVYDTMPDGTYAYNVSGSTVSIMLAPQVLTCPGMAWVSVALTSGSDMLGIFNFSIQIQADPSSGVTESENYFSYDTLDKINAAIVRALAGVDSIDGKITEALADLTRMEVNFVDTAEECTDTSKLYVLPDGYIYAYQLLSAPDVLVNYLLSSTDADGNLYNGGLGWKSDTRLNSSGAEASAEGTECTGFIPLTQGDVLRFENMKIIGDTTTNSTQYIVFYDSGKNKIKHIYTHDVYALENQVGYLTLDGNGYWAAYDTANVSTVDTSLDWSDLSYFRVSAEEITEESAIYINEQTVPGEGGWAWVNTGHAFIPADYEDRILSLESTAAVQKSAVSDTQYRLYQLERGCGSITLPSYWQSHCAEKAAAIQSAMENAGRDKSAFLWYTDAHWAYGAQVSPYLLMYLHQNTAMNKVNFGGDIVDDYAVSAEECMDGLRQWRLAVRSLPNHHSVLGNHDDDIAELTTANQRYGFLMAAEEGPHVVRGGDMYYYIDDPSEKTRYLYLDTSMCVSLDAAGDADALWFAAQALDSVPAGWHIVAISHIWFLYADTSTPTVGSIPDYCKMYLDLFDGYNARKVVNIAVGTGSVSYNFTGAGGRVEFCIGGHTHIDHDFTSDGGIPVVLTETDSAHLRSDLSYATGTVSEASVSGIVADYGSGVLHIIRIGRGSDRDVALQS